MFRLYRELERGEFFVVGVDCAQGGTDSNFIQCMSKSRADVPLVFSKICVAAEMTPILHQALEYIYNKTGVQPVVAIERENGGVSELDRLSKLNREGKYRIYTKKRYGLVSGEKETELLGWTTNAQTRPQMLGDLKQAIDGRIIDLYDKITIDQLGKFIINKRGRAEAAPNCHDDGVMSLAIAWQLYQTETPPILSAKMHIRTGKSSLRGIY